MMKCLRDTVLIVLIVHIVHTARAVVVDMEATAVMKAIRVHVSGETYGTHSNVATPGSHSNHANHASHSSESHYNNADASTGLHSNTSVITPDESISVADVSGILTPQNNYIAPVEGTLNTAVSIPDEVKN